ncbi:hypothetical protein [Burkholderia ubonensis]|uniref:hypothetical protein n=1 Tax=Burkholderia ubonensis TaxID=101571 RepID=UPI000B30FFDA
MEQTTQQNAVLGAQGHELSETVAAFRLPASERAPSSASPDAAGAWRALAA